MREGGGILEVVRDEHGRQAELLEQLTEIRAHAGARVSVERRERLVEQEQGGVARKGARERDALTFASGELRDAGARELGDAEALEQRPDLPVAAGAEADVVPDVEVREQGVLLEQVADPTPLRWHIDAPEPYRAARCRRARRAPRPA